MVKKNIVNKKYFFLQTLFYHSNSRPTESGASYKNETIANKKKSLDLIYLKSGSSIKFQKKLSENEKPSQFLLNGITHNQEVVRDKIFLKNKQNLISDSIPIGSYFPNYDSKAGLNKIHPLSPINYLPGIEHFNLTDSKPLNKWTLLANSEIKLQNIKDEIKFLKGFRSYLELSSMKKLNLKKNQLKKSIKLGKFINKFPYKKSFFCYWLFPFIGFISCLPRVNNENLFLNFNQLPLNTSYSLNDISETNSNKPVFRKISENSIRLNYKSYEAKLNSNKPKLISKDFIKISKLDHHLRELQEGDAVVCHLETKIKEIYNFYYKEFEKNLLENSTLIEKNFIPVNIENLKAKELSLKQFWFQVSLKIPFSNFDSNHKNQNRFLESQKLINKSSKLVWSNSTPDTPQLPFGKAGEFFQQSNFLNSKINQSKFYVHKLKKGEFNLLNSYFSFPYKKTNLFNFSRENENLNKLLIPFETNKINQNSLSLINQQTKLNFISNEKYKILFATKLEKNPSLKPIEFSSSRIQLNYQILNSKSNAPSSGGLPSLLVDFENQNNFNLKHGKNPVLDFKIASRILNNLTGENQDDFLRKILMKLDYWIQEILFLEEKNSFTKTNNSKQFNGKFLTKFDESSFALNESNIFSGGIESLSPFFKKNLLVNLNATPSFGAVQIKDFKNLSNSNDFFENTLFLLTNKNNLSNFYLKKHKPKNNSIKNLHILLKRTEPSILKKSNHEKISNLSDSKVSNSFLFKLNKESLYYLIFKTFYNEFNWKNELTNDAVVYNKKNQNSISTLQKKIPAIKDRFLFLDEPLIQTNKRKFNQVPPEIEPIWIANFKLVSKFEIQKDLNETVLNTNLPSSVSKINLKSGSDFFVKKPFNTNFNRTSNSEFFDSINQKPLSDSTKLSFKYLNLISTACLNSLQTSFSNLEFLSPSLNDWFNPVSFAGLNSQSLKKNNLVFEDSKKSNFDIILSKKTKVLMADDQKVVNSNFALGTAIKDNTVIFQDGKAKINLKGKNKKLTQYQKTRNKYFKMNYLKEKDLNFNAIKTSSNGTSHLSKGSEPVLSFTSDFLDIYEARKAEKILRSYLSNKNPLAGSKDTKKLQMLKTQKNEFSLKQKRYFTNPTKISDFKSFHIKMMQKGLLKKGFFSKILKLRESYEGPGTPVFFCKEKKSKLSKAKFEIPSGKGGTNRDSSNLFFSNLNKNNKNKSSIKQIPELNESPNLLIKNRFFIKKPNSNLTTKMEKVSINVIQKSESNFANFQKNVNSSPLAIYEEIFNSSTNPLKKFYKMTIVKNSENGLSFPEKTKKTQLVKYTYFLENKKYEQKQLRKNKQRRETRRRKKRKRWFPRPIWSRSKLYKKFLESRRFPLITFSSSNKDALIGLESVKSNSIFRNKIYRNYNTEILFDSILSNSTTPSGSEQSLNFSNSKLFSTLWFSKNKNQLKQNKLIESNLMIQPSKSIYEISRPTLSELRKTFWKSYWLRCNLTPYVKRIKFYLNEIKKNNVELKKDFYFNSFITKNFLGLNGLKREINEVTQFYEKKQYSKNLNELFNKKLKSGINSDLYFSENQKTFDSHLQVGEKWQKATNIRQYNRILFKRMQKIILNIRLNLSPNGHLNSRSSKFGNRRLPKSKPIKEFWVKFGKAISLEFRTSPAIPFSGDIARLRQVWALNKSNLSTFKILNQRKDLWLSEKMRSIDRSNKSKRYFYTIFPWLKPSKNFLNQVPLIKIFSGTSSTLQVPYDTGGSSNEKKLKPSNELVNDQKVVCNTLLSNNKIGIKECLESLKLTDFFKAFNIFSIKNFSINGTPPVGGATPIKKNSLNFKSLYDLSFAQNENKYVNGYIRSLQMSQYKLRKKENKLAYLGFLTKKTNQLNLSALRNFKLRTALENQKLKKEFPSLKPSKNYKTNENLEPSLLRKSKSNLNQLNITFVNKFTSDYNYWWNLFPIKRIPDFYSANKNDGTPPSGSESLLIDSSNKYSRGIGFLNNSNFIIWISSFLFHFCAFLFLINLPEIRGLIKVQMTFVSIFIKIYLEIAIKISLWTHHPVVKQIFKKLSQSEIKMSKFSTKKSTILAKQIKTRLLGDLKTIEYYTGKKPSEKGSLNNTKIRTNYLNHLRTKSLLWSKNGFLENQKNLINPVLSSNSSNEEQSEIVTPPSGGQVKPENNQIKNQSDLNNKKDLNEIYINQTGFIGNPAIYRKGSFFINGVPKSDNSKIKSNFITNQVKPDISLAKLSFNNKNILETSLFLNGAKIYLSFLTKISKRKQLKSLSSLNIKKRILIQRKFTKFSSKMHYLLLDLIQFSILFSCKFALSSYYFSLRIFDVLQVFLNTIYSLFEKPGELFNEWFGYAFTVGWSSDLTTITPDSQDILGMNAISRITRGIRPFIFGSSGMLLLNFYTLNKVCLWIPPVIPSSSNSLLTPFIITSSSLINRRILHFYEALIEKLYQPDNDLLNRQKKGIIFWDLWSEVLIDAADSEAINISELASLTDEQNRLLEKLEVYLADKSSNGAPLEGGQVKPAKSDGTPPGGGDLEGRLNLLIKLNNNSFLKINKFNKSSKDGLKSNFFLRKLNSAIFFRKPYYLEMNKAEFNFDFETDSALNLSTQNKSKVKSFNQKNWSVNQFLNYQGKDTDLFIQKSPPKSFAHVPSIKYSQSAQHAIGTIVCQIFCGMFTQQVAKNVLIISHLNGVLSSATRNEAVFIQSIAGETELKIIIDNAQRYSMVQGGVAIGIKLLREVFEALSLHTPCLFLLEDIHHIGSRRPMLLSDQSSIPDEEFSSEIPLAERNQVFYEISKHFITHYKKPYRGDFSLSIPTNHFCFNLFLGISSSEIRANNIGPILPYSKSENALQKRLYKSSLLEVEANDLLAPPATSPFSIMLLKEDKKLKRKQIVKEMPLTGFSTEKLALISKTNYSIRVKIAILTDLALANVGVKLDMITDLLVIIDSVKGNRGFVVFATTHVPYILDPALRRPGRFDETISLPLIPNLFGRWEILKTNFRNLIEPSPYSSVILGMPFDLTSTLNNSNPIVNSTQILASNLALKKIRTKLNFVNSVKSNSITLKPLTLTYNLNNKQSNKFDLRFEKSLKLIINPFQLKNQFFETSLREQNKKINNAPSGKPQGGVPVPQGAKNVELTKENINLIQNQFQLGFGLDSPSTLNKGGDLNSLENKQISKFALENRNLIPFSNSFFANHKVVNYSNYKKKSKILTSLITRSYFSASQIVLSMNSIKSFLPSNSQHSIGTLKSGNKKKTNFMIDQPKQLMISFDSHLIQNNIYLSLYASPKTLKIYLTNIIAGKLGEFFISLNSTAFPLSKNLNSSNNKLLEISGFQNLYGMDDTAFEDWTSLLFEIMTKRYLSNNNLIIPKLLYFPNNGALKNPLLPPSSTILLPLRRYENYRRTFYTQSFENKTQFKGKGLQDILELHQQQRFVKRLYKLPFREFFRSELINNKLTGFSNSFIILPTLEKNINFSTNINWYYRSRLLNRHKNYLNNQWWNGHLNEHSIESTFLSDIDWRFTFVESLGDMFIDFPDSEQFYNVQNRRWMVAKTSSKNWFHFEKTHYNAAINHSILECFIKAFNILDNSREILDFYVFSSLNECMLTDLKEIQMIRLIKRFLK